MKNLSDPYTGLTYGALSLIGLLLLSGCETAKSRPTGCAYTQEEMTKTQQRAEAGDPKAQYLVAGWHMSRFCLAHDVSKGMDWYQRAADQGYQKAQYSLAQLYFNGYGVPQDINLGLSWYRKAAEQGDVEAQIKLASHYRTESNDLNRAVKWYEKAAKQGDIRAIRSLGYIYLNGEGGQKNLDEAEKWFRLAVQEGDSSSRVTVEQIEKEKDPAAWERQQEERLRAEKEERLRQQRLLAEEKEKKLKQKQENIRQAANRAKARLGMVSVSVVEEAQSRKSRKKVQQKLGNLQEPKGPPPESHEFLEISLVSTLYGAPGPLVAVMYYGFEGIKNAAKTRKEKAKIRPSLGTLTKKFSKENIEQDFKQELLATAVRQQAPNLLVSDSDDTASSAPRHLNIQLKEFRMITVPPNWHIARLWATTKVSLKHQKGDTAFEKRFCYGSPSFSIEEAAKNSVDFKENLNNVYRGLSSRILSEVLGLAADDNAPSAWTKTEKMCSSATSPVKVAQGRYIGEMKDGKPHGYGEMRYKRGIYFGSIYRGNFENGKANGTGRCRGSSGWWDCTFVDGKRL